MPQPTLSSTVARQRPWRPWHWARAALQGLDPERDAQRILHLSFEVRYGAPIFTYALFSLAFARQVAVPEIAAVLYRGGQGLIVTDTRKRNDDTLIFFGELFRHGDTPAGRAIAQRLKQMHDRFGIPNELHLYTLATLVCEPHRASRRLCGRQVISDAENQAGFNFWRVMGGHMGITDIPDSFDALLRWMEDFERTRYGHTTGGALVAQALAQEFAARWFPRFAQRWGQGLYHALFDAGLAAAHQTPAPGWSQRLAARWGARFYLLVWTRWWRDPPERDLVSTFGARYGQGYALERVGADADTARRRP